MTDYLTLADVLFLHHDQVERYGGAHGIRDMGAVEAAVFRPQSGYYEDMIAEAAALMESLAMNHPFIDGNKRVAFAATHSFLKINGFEIKQTADAVYEQMITFFEANNFEFATLEPWLRSISKKI